MKKFLFKYYPIFINIYTIWILYMMFFGFYRGSVDPNDYSVVPYPFESINNMIQAAYPTKEVVKNIGGNIILFAPYGFLGIMYPKLNRYRNLLLVFFIAINYLEFSQFFFKRGYAELDDVIMNCFGMTLGFVFFKFLNRK